MVQESTDTVLKDWEAQSIFEIEETSEIIFNIHFFTVPSQRFLGAST